MKLATSKGTAVADTPPGTIDLMKESETSIWLLFPTAAARKMWFDRYYGCWLVTSDRCMKLDYYLDWRDVNGYGLELAQYAGPGTQLYRTRNTP